MAGNWFLGGWLLFVWWLFCFTLHIDALLVL